MIFRRIFLLLRKYQMLRNPYALVAAENLLCVLHLKELIREKDFWDAPIIQSADTYRICQMNRNKELFRSDFIF